VRIRCACDSIDDGVALDLADRQNAHSMTLAVTEAIELCSCCRIATVNSFSGHKSALQSILIATKGFGKAVRYNDAIKANESVTFLAVSLWCFARASRSLISLMS
jgi:hypothetical protein